MAARCTNCGEVIQASNGGRLPPWCLSCGATIAHRTKTTADTATVQDKQASRDDGTDRCKSEACPSEDFDDTSPIGVYNFSLRGYLHKVGPAILLAAIFGAIGGLLLLLALTRPNSGTMVPGLLMAGFAVGFLVYAFAACGKCIRRVEVFADGIRWHGPKGTGQLAWANVESVFRSEIVLNGFPISELKLVGKTGRQVAFDLTIGRFKELAGLVQGRCAEAMHQQKHEQAMTCAADFGPVRVSPAGICVEGSLIPWESVTNYSVSRGRLWLQFVHGSHAVALGMIPNYLVLFSLMDEFALAARQAAGQSAMAC